MDTLLTKINRVLRKGGKAFLSYYNKEAFAHAWWQPWQTSMEAVLNPISNILEVPIIDPDTKKCETFKIYAKSYSLAEIQEQLKDTDLLL